MTQINPPAHLKAATKRWFCEVAETFELEPHHIKLLIAAAETWDRYCQARDHLKKNGLTYLDRFEQPKSRPEVSIERDSRLAFARLLRELALDFGPDDTRPDRLGGRS